MRIQQSSIFYGFILCVFLVVGSGCASTRQSTTTESTVEKKSTDIASDSDIVATSTTTTTTTETKPQETSVVGGVFHIIGSVLAFPFVVIGGLLRMIF